MPQLPGTGSWLRIDTRSLVESPIPVEDLRDGSGGWKSSGTACGELIEEKMSPGASPRILASAPVEGWSRESKTWSFTAFLRPRIRICASERISSAKFSSACSAGPRETMCKIEHATIQDLPRSLVRGEVSHSERFQEKARDPQRFSRGRVEC